MTRKPQITEATPAEPNFVALANAAMVELGRENDEVGVSILASWMVRNWPRSAPTVARERTERVMREALSSIAGSAHCMYECNEASSYGTGVADGHRCAATTAREALLALAAADEKEGT